MSIWCLVDTQHHLNIALAVCSFYENEEFLIIATKPISAHDISIAKKNIELLDADSSYAGDFFNIENTAARLISQLEKKASPKKFLTFYDTHVLFLFLRDKFNVNWRDVGLIEDGLGNYIMLSMPRWSSRVIKWAFNKSTKRFSYPSSRYSLGMNPHISKIYSINSGDVIRNQTCDVIDVKEKYWCVISERYGTSTAPLTTEANIVMVPPLLAVRKAPRNYVEHYITKLLHTADSERPMVFKLHPREGKELEEIIVSVCNERNRQASILKTEAPIESYFFAYTNFSLCGPPSTACVIASLFFSEKLVDRIKILPDKSNPYSQQHIDYFSSQNNYKILA